MLLTRRVTFFGGKGGVGKTTIAACAALAAADSGRSVLLVSTDPAHSTGDVLDTPLGRTGIRVAPGLEAIELDPEAEAESYIEDVKARLAEAVPPRLAKEVERQVDVARVSPGAEEAALFERFTRVLDGWEGWDHLVFDTAPTAQTLRLLGLPELMSMWMNGLIQRRRTVNAWGRMWRNVAEASAAVRERGRDGSDDALLAALEERRDRFQRARAILTDSARTGFLFVVTPERLPILETTRAVKTLRKYAIPVQGVVVNRVERDASERGGDRATRGDQSERLREIAAEFAGLATWTLAQAPREVVGLEALRELGGSLTVGADS